MTELLYKDITFDIRSACFWVWKEFRGAFKEKVVDRALSIELKKRGRVVEDQKRLDIIYQGVKVGTYVPDKIVDDKVIVELKSKEFLAQEDIDQFWKYLKGSKYKVGLLINFGPKKLEIKRIVYDTARMAEKKNPRLDLRPVSAFRSAEKGFTLMEIVVATTIFAFISTAMMSLFNYTLKINRRGEALRQASQGLRGIVETLVKEVHNGEIYYSVSSDGLIEAPVDPCPKPSDSNYNINVGSAYNGGNIYEDNETRLAIITKDGIKECIYWAKPDLKIQKADVTQSENLNASNFKINNLAFLVRPLNFPLNCSTNDCMQPMVTVLMNILVKLPTGEEVPLNYQTTIASNNYGYK